MNDMSKLWSLEFWRILGLALAALMLGWLTGWMGWCLFLAAAGYLGWHLSHIARLERALRKGTLPFAVDMGGIWGEIYYHLHSLRQRHWQRRRMLTAYLARFREFTAAMPDATVVLRAGGEIDWFNEAAGRLLGLRSPQDTGRHIANLVRTPVFVEYLAARRYMGNGVDIVSPVDVRVMLHVIVIPYGQEQRLLVARDVTRVHRLEQMRRDFIANVSHELRTPLTVIGGFVETIKDSGGMEEWRRPLELMEQQSVRMRQLVDDLLLLSRLETDIEPPPPELVSVPVMLAAMQEEARSLSGGAHRFHFDIDPAVYLRGSAAELRSAFINLVSNAIRYTPEGGEIFVSWRAGASGAHFSVRDTGIGIAAQHIPRLTERFYRVDVARSRQTGGTGLGLAIVKHVLERHDAGLHIESEPGKGSLFRCDFPPSRVERRAGAAAVTEVS